jgi:spore germination protein YaaH
MDNLHDAKVIPAQKMVVSVANYGYDWPGAGQEIHPTAKI